jgi:restriction system protein
MAVPDYQSLMLPLLKISSDRNEHNLSETIEVLAQQLKLSEQDRNEITTQREATQI